jgi:glyoxylase-like metal-dependent hydrolase (beta-lactamase superfamily II)
VSAPGFRTLLAPNPSPMTLDGSRTFIVGRRNPVVIDPGPNLPGHVAVILAALGDATPAAILLTHAHPDHSEAAPTLREATGALVMMARGALWMPFGNDIVDRWLADGDSVESDAGPVEALATPGHVPEHLAFLWRGPEAAAGGALFAGDLFMGAGDTTLVAPPEGDLAAYLRSLDAVERAAPAVLLPSHGPEIADAAAAVARYRAHRMDRIAQVRAALAKTGPARPGELLDAVYGDALHPALRPAAEGSLLAVLEYLRSTGEATELPGRAFTLAGSR